MATLQYLFANTMISVIVDLCDRHLHSQDGKDVDDDEEDEGEVSQGAQGGDDDTQQNLIHTLTIVPIYVTFMASLG